MSGEDRAAYRSVAGLTEQAEALYFRGRYAAAQPLFEKILEIHRRLLTDEHPLTAGSYNDLGLTLNHQGKYAQARPFHVKALEIRQRLLTDDHPRTADSYSNAAANLDDLSRYAEALPLLEKALEIYRRLFTDDHRDSATAYNNLALHLNDQGKYAAAQPLMERSLAIRLRLFTDNHIDTAVSYNNLGMNLNTQGKYAEAQPLFEKAMAIRRRLLGDDHPDIGQAYNNVAYNLYMQGNYAAAQPLYEQALENRRRLLTDEHPETALSYNNLAMNIEAQGKFEAAQPLYEKSLAIFRRMLTDDHPSTARSYNNLAFNLSGQRKFEAARPLYEKALAIRQQRLTDDHPLTALSFDNLGENLNSLGDYAAAHALYQKALEVRRRLLTDDHPLTARSYHNLACNLQDQGRYAEARPLIEKALEINRRLLTDDHIDTVADYHHLACILHAQGKYAAARDSWLSAARSQDAIRLRVAFTGLERAAPRRSTRPALAAVQARLGRPAEAWQALEEDLGRGLLDELAARRDSRLTPAERDRLRELTSGLERLDKLVETMPKGLEQAERASRFEDLKHQRELASIALGEFRAGLAKDHGPLAGRVAGLAEIQAALPADAALVAWVDFLPAGPNAADPDGEHWGVVVRSRGVPAWVPIAGTGPGGLWTVDDYTLAGRVRMELRSRPGASTAAPRPLVDRLRAQRLEPLRDALGTAAGGLPPARRLIVLPSRGMTGIPVEAILAPDDTRTVSYAPSATVLKHLREQPRPERQAGLLALGDPVFERPEFERKPPRRCRTTGSWSMRWRPAPTPPRMDSRRGMSSWATTGRRCGSARI